MLELAELIWRKIYGDDDPSATFPILPFEHDVARRIPSTEKAKRVLGFEATTSLEEMLDEVIPWVAQALENGAI